MSHLSASRIKVGAAVFIVATVPLAIWFVARSKAPERPNDIERLQAALASRSLDRHEHGDVTPRSKDDPRNARIRGCVTRAGKAVPGAKLTAMVWPVGMSFTLDHAVAGRDGCYEIVITAMHLHRKQVAEVSVDRPLVGRLLVPVEPSGTTQQADFEVGAGFVIRGVVRDAKGASVSGVLIMEGRDRSETVPDDAGRFAIRVSAAGRVQLRVPEYEGNVPAVFDVARLDGELTGVVLSVGERVVQPRSSHERRLAGATPYEIKPVSLRPNVNPPYGGWCTAWARRQGGELEATVTDSGFELDLTPANVRLTCDQMAGFEDNSRELELSKTSSPIEMPVVPIVLNGVQLGAELRSHPKGALVTGVAAEAKAAGLVAGDIIVAVDNVPVAGFDYRSVHELGFNIPPGHDISWTIERNGTRRTLGTKAPGPWRAPLYLY